MQTKKKKKKKNEGTYNLNSGIKNSSFFLEVFLTLAGGKKSSDWTNYIRYIFTCVSACLNVLVNEWVCVFVSL